MDEEQKTADVLIVDDTVANLKVLTELLKRHNYKVRAVLNGPMALTAADTAPPELILLDIKMPEMDGYAVCDRLKRTQKTRDIPVIFISALDDALDKVKAFSVGGVDYISKPFQEEEVLARVENHLKIARLQHTLEQRNQTLQQSMDALQKKQTEVLELQRQQVLGEERERIMRDMHDGIGGMLISTLAMLEAGVTDHLIIDQALRAALDDLRLMIDSLDPLQEDNLTLALGTYRARILPRLHDQGLVVDWPVNDLPLIPDLGPHKVLQVLRILQEAITNVLKHAKATQLTVCAQAVSEPSAGVLIQVEDDGQGLGNDFQIGRGLNNMHRRADGIGCRLDMESTSEGTRESVFLLTDPGK
jgi:DNA-binding response OmpR family regulator